MVYKCGANFLHSRKLLDDDAGWSVYVNVHCSRRPVAVYLEEEKDDDDVYSQQHEYATHETSEGADFLIRHFRPYGNGMSLAWMDTRQWVRIYPDEVSTPYLYIG